MDKMTKWLVAHDFSETADHALRVALTMLSQQGGGTLVLAHAHPHGTTADGVGVDLRTVGPGVGAELDQAYFADAARSLAAIAASVSAPGVTLEIQVRWGHPAETIVALAEEVGCDLLIVGSHGRRGFKRLLLGSVAEAIVRRAHGTVLIVKPPQVPEQA